MSHVVTENCIQCKFGACIEICPVLCFHEGPNFVVIDPDECVDCGMCVNVCDARAIFADINLPAEFVHFAKLNKEYSAIWPLVTSFQQPITDPGEWNFKPNKLAKLVTPS